MFTNHLLTGSTVAGIAAAALALAACGGSGSGGAGTGTDSGSGDSDDPQTQMLAFAQCMREHGVDMPDPEVDANGRVRMRIGSKDTPRATMEAAQQACQDKAPRMGGGGGDDGDNAAMQEHGLKLAQCMREHGIEQFPDPTNGGIRITPDMGIDPDDPAFQQAQSECEDEIGEPPAPEDAS
jgi:hypothetical protein